MSNKTNPKFSELDSIVYDYILSNKEIKSVTNYLELKHNLGGIKVMAVSEKSIEAFDKLLQEALNNEDDETLTVQFVERYLQYRDAGLDFGDAVETARSEVLEIDDDDDDDDDDNDNDDDANKEEK